MSHSTSAPSIFAALLPAAVFAFSTVLATPGAASGQDAIYACAQPSGVLYLVEEAGACKSPIHTALEWSVTGGDEGGVPADEPATRPSGSETRPLELLNNWVPYEGDYESPTVTRQGDLVVVEGMIRSGALAASVAQLPAGWAPDKRLVFNSISRDERTRVDVLEDGTIRVVQGSNAWVTLSGIVFKAAGGN